jgi:hypothetical protein
MASYSPLYNANGLITSYYSQPDPTATRYTGVKTVAPTVSSQNSTPGVAGQDDLEAWLKANIPGYGGANPTSPASTQTSNIGSLDSYAKTLQSSFVTPPPPSVAPITIPGTPAVDPMPSYQPPAPAPLTPSDPKLDALTNQSLKNIGSGLQGQLSPDVIAGLTQRGAERGISVGSNSPNAGAAILRAMGLTSMDVQQAAEKNLQPYQERSAAVNLANIGQQGENYRAILDASEAMRRLQLSESGQMQRLSVQEQGDTQRAILAGQQALQQISQKGNTDIAMALINANADQQRQILAGAQAMQQLQLSESGKIAALSAQMKSQLQRDVIAAQNALAQINAQGLNQRQNTALAGQYQLANTQLQGQIANNNAQNELDQILAKYNQNNRNSNQNNNQYDAGYNYQDPNQGEDNSLS